MTPDEERGRLERLPPDLAGNLNVQRGTAAYDRAMRAAEELARRGIEPVKLYQPTAIQDKYHRCNAMECLFQAGNQVGKSLAGFLEDARAVLGCDPYNKYPKRDGRLAIVGYKESHIALNIYRYLLEPGAFKIIRDLETGFFRCYRPWDENDVERESDAIPAPPMLPRRYIKKIHWKSKSGNIFKRIDLTTGWKIYAFSSTAKPDQGFALDLAHIDEDIINEEWYTELIGRLLMRKGKLRWTALPHMKNDALNRVAERGEEEALEHARGGPPPTTVVVRATIFDNPFMSDEVRASSIARWKAIGEDEYRKRALGELVTDTVRMYPTFSKDVHAIQRYRESHAHLFGDYLKTGQIPKDWCLRLYVDPGFDTAAGLILATLPGDDELHVAIDELYLHQCTPSIFVEAFARKANDLWFQSFTMDAHGGRLTSLATGERPQDLYEEELVRHNLQSVETKFRFRAGCDDIAFRETKLRERLAVRSSGLPQFMFDEERCPNLLMEMVRFRKVQIAGETIDKGNRRKRTHLVDCYEYAAADRLIYNKPPARRSKETPGERRARLFRERKAARRQAAFINNPGAYPTGIVLGSGG